MKFVRSTIKGGRVALDGNEFIDCRFEETVMVFAATSPTSFKGCKFVNVRWEFDGPAKLTLEFLAGLYHGAGDGGRLLVETVFETIRRSSPGPESPVAASKTSAVAN